MDNLMLKKEAFSSFVVSVLRQMAAQRRAEIIFDKVMVAHTANGLPDEYLMFDAVAPDGFESFSGYVYFEFKTPRSGSSEVNRIENFRKRIRRVSRNQKPVGILIINGGIDTLAKRSESAFLNNEIPIYVWGREIIEEWIREYPVDYSNAVNLSNKKKNKESSYIPDITKNDFEEKKRKNLDAVMHIVEKDDNFALVLGAGISVDPGAQSWDSLLNQFTNELEQKKLIDDSSALSKKIGGSSLITAQFCKELYSTEDDYYWAIHEGLYARRKPLNSKYTIYHIAQIISKCQWKKHFRVLTYNYDDYLETYLKSEKISHCTLYNEESLPGLASAQVLDSVLRLQSLR